MSEASGFALPKGYRLQNYVIERVLGQGGFGITYLAHDEALRQKVAIKEFFPGSITARNAATSAVHAQTESVIEVFNWGLQRFLEEARILARLSHPNIARVLYFMPLNNTGYMVMEYEQGDPLDKWVDRFDAGRLPQQAVIDLLDPITEALAIVHGLGIAHRDIKPENIYIRADGSPVILDFGAARNTLSGKSRTLAAIVSAGYSPIEQYSDVAEQGPWTDIYATAGVAYFLITGEAPPDAPIRIEAEHAGRSDPCRRLADEKLPGFDKGFLRSIDRGLALRATLRPQTMEEWRQELFDTQDSSAGARRKRGARAAGRGKSNSSDHSSKLWTGAAAAVGVCGLAALGFYFVPGFGEKDRIGNSPDTAHQLGLIVPGQPQLVTENVGGDDAKDFIAFQVADTVDLTLKKDQWPTAAALSLSSSQGSLGVGLESKDELLWRLEKGTYNIEVSSDGLLSAAYRLTFQTRAVDPEDATRGRSANKAIRVDSKKLFSDVTENLAGRLWRSGDEMFYSLRLPNSGAISASVSGNSDNVVVSLVDRQGLSIGDTKSNPAKLDARLPAGDYTLIVTSRVARPVAFDLQISGRAEEIPTGVKGPSLSDGTRYSKAKPLGKIAAKTPPRTVGLPATTANLFAKFDVTEPGVLQLKTSNDAISTVIVTDAKSRNRMATLDLKGENGTGTITLPIGQYIIELTRASTSSASGELALRLLSEETGNFDVGQLTAQPIERVIEIPHVSAAVSPAKVRFELTAAAQVLLRLNGADEKGLDQAVTVGLIDTKRERRQSISFESRATGEIKIPLEAGIYTLELQSKADENSQSNQSVKVFLTSLARLAEDQVDTQPNATRLELGGDGRASRIGEVGGADSRDLFALNTTASGNLTLELGNLSKNADLLLMSENETILGASRIAGAKSERIVRSLEPGRYFVSVDSRTPWLTSYTLDVSFSPIDPNSLSSSPGSSKNTPAHFSAKMDTDVKASQIPEQAIATARQRLRADIVAQSMSRADNLTKQVKPGLKFLEDGVPFAETWKTNWQTSSRVNVSGSARVRVLSGNDLSASVTNQLVKSMQNFDVRIKSNSDLTVGVFAWSEDGKVVRLYPHGNSDKEFTLMSGNEIWYSEISGRKLLSAPLPGADKSNEALIVAGCTNSGVAFQELAPAAGQDDVEQSIAAAVQIEGFLERLSGFCPEGLSIGVASYTVSAR